jgi:prepilin-type N-terminal cleavage/methylation domain-containing protein
MRRLRHGKLRRSGRGAFTLIELIFVMALLAIGAALVAPHMTSFFHGRVLSSESRRMLSLVHYGQSRAVSEGVPVIVWFDARNASYGMSIQSGFADVDDHASTFTLGDGLTLETPTTDPLPVSEQGDEQFGLPQGLPVIRFLPDGFYDEVSVRKVVIHQGLEGAIELVPTPNRLDYELLPIVPY